MPLPRRSGLAFARACALLALVSSGCGGSGDAAARRNVLLISVDTLRRDAVGFHGRFPSPTPELDALAQESVVFQDAYTVSPVTLPAHASLLTGLYPVAHGVRDNGATQFPDAADTLAELLARVGYRSRAVVAAYVLNDSFGLSQGFEQYQAPSRSLGKLELAIPQTRGDVIVERGLEAVDELSAGDAPFFLWLHLYDVHAPHDAPGARPSDPQTSRYLADVAYADGQLGVLFDGLKARGLWEDTVIVMTSDHGEGLEDGRESTHGYFVFDQTMRVPLLLKHPDLAPGAVEGTVSLVDVVPTVLEILRVPAPPAGFDGTSLFAAAKDGRAPTRTVGIESYLPLVSHGWAPFQGGVRGDDKVIRSRALERYDRAQDPGERDNLHREGDGLTAELMGDVTRIFEENARRLDREVVVLGAAEQAQLESLGYSGSTSGLDDIQVDFDALPDTYERFPLCERFWGVITLLEQGLNDEAVRVLRELAVEDPDNPLVLTNLAEILTLDHETALRNVDEAERALLRALPLRPGDLSIPWTLSRCAKLRAEQHRAEMAAAHAAGDEQAGRQATTAWRTETDRFHGYLRRVLELQPKEIRALGVLADALAKDALLSDTTGQKKLAERQRREALELLERVLPLLGTEPEHRAECEALRDDVRSRLR